MVYTEASPATLPAAGRIFATPPRREYSEEEIKSANTPTIQGRFEMDFEVMYVIGNGTFGSVYAAKHKMSQSKYAVKKSKSIRGQRNNMLKEVQYMAEAQEGGENEEGNNHIVRYMGAWIEDEKSIFRWNFVTCQSRPYLKSRAKSAKS